MFNTASCRIVQAAHWTSVLVQESSQVTSPAPCSHPPAVQQPGSQGACSNAQAGDAQDGGRAAPRNAQPFQAALHGVAPPLGALLQGMPPAVAVGVVARPAMVRARVRPLPRSGLPLVMVRLLPVNVLEAVLPLVRARLLPVRVLDVVLPLMAVPALSVRMLASIVWVVAVPAWILVEVWAGWPRVPAGVQVSGDGIGTDSTLHGHMGVQQS